MTLLLTVKAQAQTNSLPRLLAERKVLTTQYAAASAQRHSLFGNKPSKKDLQEVVDALQGIVNQDEQIVAELNRSALTAQTAAQHYGTVATNLASTSRDDRNLTAQRVAELQNDLANAQQRERQQAARYRSLEADVTELRHGRLVRDGLLGGLSVVCVALFFWRRKRQ